MERVGERGQGFPLCLVDYAHTPDALVLALEAVRPITPGWLVIVFGSDGDRDRGKRPLMGAIAARLADVLVVTDENPRSEDPASIRAAILDGVAGQRPDRRDVHEVAPRSAAIRRAMAPSGISNSPTVRNCGICCTRVPIRPCEAPLRPTGINTWRQMPAAIAPTAHCTAATQLAPPSGVVAEKRRSLMPKLVTKSSATTAFP